VTFVGIQSLVDRYGDFVWRSVRRLGVSDAASDDACQQVFLTACRKLEEILPGKERSFLFTLCVHVAAHFRRTQARRRETSDEPIADVADGTAAPDELLDRQRARALLDEALDALPLELRAVFVLFELEEATTAEIAEILDIPPGTVASRLRRARKEFLRVTRRLRAKLTGPRGEK
jgi:RNA polymerase sigma-70 factor (ECF subfamily)